MATTQTNQRQYWLWVTHPEYYLDEEGNDRADLDPSTEVDVGGWWTCHKSTRMGDLVFLWRTRPKSDIGYLIQAASDAYSIVDDESAREHKWKYGCDYQVLYKFENPVTIEDLREDPYLQNWGVYRIKFFKSVFRIQPEYWDSLNQLASKKNPGYQGFVKHIQQETVVDVIREEKELEEILVRDLGRLKSSGYDLELYTDHDGRTGRQYVCKGNGGRIDLLCKDRQEERYVVIELKNICASHNTFGQICNYIGWVQDEIAKCTPVIGLVISRGCDNKFKSSCKVTDRVRQLDLTQLGFK